MPGQGSALCDLTASTGATPKSENRRKRRAPPSESGRSPTRSSQKGEDGECPDSASALLAVSAANANAQAAAVVASALVAQQAPAPVFPPPPPPASQPAVVSAAANTASGATLVPGNAIQSNPIFSEVSVCMLQALAAGNPHARDTDFFVRILEVLVDSGSRMFSFYRF